MQKYTTTIEAQNNAFLTQLVGAQVSIYNFGTTTLATIYSDNGVTLATNPLTADANGQVSFYAANGRYSLIAAKVGYSNVSIMDILLNDPANATAGIFTSISASGFASLSTLGLALATTVMTSSATVADNVSIVFVRVGGTVTLTLPTPVSGKLLFIKTLTANLVNSSASNVGLDGAATGTAILTATQGKWVLLQTDGINWYNVANN